MIIKCKECGNKISNKSDKCINCGYKPKNVGCSFYIFLFIGFFVIVSIIKSTSDNSNYSDKPLLKNEKPIIQKQEPPKSKWTIEKQVSAIDDSTTVTAKINAETAISGWPAEVVTPELLLRCKENKTEVYIHTGLRAANESGSYNSATVRIRFDKQPVKKYLTTESTDGKALFFSKSIDFIKEMEKHELMIFEFVPFNSPIATTSFDIKDMKNEIGDLKTSCKWK